MSHDHSVCPFVYLSRSFSQTDRPIDRSICSFVSISLALSDFFSIDFILSVRVSFARSFLFSRAEALSIEQQEICVRHDRILLRFAFGYPVFRTVAEPAAHKRGRIVQTSGFSSSFVCRFVYLSFDDRIVSSASTPSTSFSLHPRHRAPPTRIFFRFLFNKTVSLSEKPGREMSDSGANENLKRDNNVTFRIRVGKQPRDASLFIRFGYLFEDPRGERRLAAVLCRIFVIIFEICRKKFRPTN